MSQIKNKFIPDREITLAKLNQSSSVIGDMVQWNGSIWVPITSIPTILEAVSLVTSTATANTIVTGFTLTPIAGTYLVTISARIESNANNSNGISQMFLAGVAQTATIRVFGGAGAGSKDTMHTIKQLTVNGSQAIDLRWSHSAGGFNILDRSIVCDRLF